MSQFLSKKDPVVNAFKDLRMNNSREGTKFISLTFGIRRMGRSFLDYETFESITLCHLQELARGAHQAVSLGTGILSSLFLYTSLKICSCPGRPFVRSSLESSTILVPGWQEDYFAAGWHGLLWLKPPGDLIVPYNCQRLEMWLRSTGVWNASILTKHAGGCPWPPLLSSPCSPWSLLLATTPIQIKEITPGQSLWWRSSWARRMRTLVCDGLDASNSWVFSYCVLRFSQLPSFVQNISTFSYFVQTRLPRVLHFPRWSCKVVFHRNVTWQLQLPIMCQCELRSMFPTCKHCWW